MIFKRSKAKTPGAIHVATIEGALGIPPEQDTYIVIVKGTETVRSSPSYSNFVPLSDEYEIKTVRHVFSPAWLFDDGDFYGFEGSIAKTLAEAKRLAVEVDLPRMMSYMAGPETEGILHPDHPNLELVK